MAPREIAICGTFADFRLVPSRKVVRLVLEIPIEAADAALAALGGLPNPELSRWVAVAPLKVVSVNPPADAAKPRLKIKHWPMASQIHMKCQEPTLWTFMQQHSEFAPLWHQAAQEYDGALASELAAEVVRNWCQVGTRAAIIPGSEPAERWHTLEAEYEQWQRGQNNESAA